MKASGKISVWLTVIIGVLFSLFNAQAEDGTVQWAFQTGGFVHSTPAIGPGGTIYTGSYDSNLYAVNSDGTRLWSYATEGAVHSSPAVGADGTIFFGSRDMAVYALNPDGSLKWRFKTGGEVNSSPAVGNDGTLYVGSNDGYFYALNPDGTVKWKFKTIDSQAIQSSPVIGAETTIYFGSDEMRLYALNADGTQKWQFKANSMIRSSPAIAPDGTVYVGSYDTMLYAVGSDGVKLWSFKTGGAVHSSPALDMDGTIYVGSYDHMLYAVNPDGSLKWKFSTQGVIFSSPAVGSDSMIYIPSQDKNLYAVNPDGSMKWFVGTGDLIRSSPVLGYQGSIYVGSRDNNLYAIETSSIPDTTLPEVRFTEPGTNAVDVAVDAAIQVTFSEAVNPRTMTSETFQVYDGTSNIQGAVSGNAAAFLFTPGNALAGNKEYTVTLTSDIEDLAGNKLTAPYTWQFTTTADLCPDDPLKDAPGECGCGVADTDTDGDMIPDCNDTFPQDPDNGQDSGGDETGDNGGEDGQDSGGNGTGDNVVPDNDNDGMPDDWETANGFDPFNGDDAAGDADGDGISNLDEYLNGTDPRQNENEGISLSAGWNLVSLYRVPDDNAIDAVLSPIAGSYDSVWAFIDNEWKLYDPASPAFSTLNQMQAGTGYWIKMTEPGFLGMAGNSPANAVTLTPGWNLVGYNSASSRPIDQAMAAIAGSYQAVWEFSEDGWRLYDPENSEFSNLTTLVPGRGYWIQVSAPCTWNIQ